MSHNMKDAMLTRRSQYSLTDNSPITDNEIKEIVEFVVKHVPSAFNAPSTRIVLLLGENHKRLWEITKDVLRKLVEPDKFETTEDKIDTSFASGYGTILFYEDQRTIEEMQEKFPTYKDNFPLWSQHASGMHQFAIWTLLSDAGLGASLQHYNPLIDEPVAGEWNLNPKWKLIAQMPFGTTLQPAGEKHQMPLDDRILVFR